MIRAIGGGLLVAVCLAGCIAAAFATESGGLLWKRHFAPQHEAVRREVFLETRSYNEGKLQELRKIKWEYDQAEADDKTALAFSLRHRFAEYDVNELPADLASFVRAIRLGD